MVFKKFIKGNGLPITMLKSKFKPAFTLAEVLIALGIIGIVAALTIPRLFTKCKEMQYRTTYKKVYSSLNQAIKYAQEDDGVDLTTSRKDIDDGAGVYSGDYNIGEIFKFISRYYNAKTTCFENNADKCWVCEGGESGCTSSCEGATGAPDWQGCRKSSYAFVDANGVAYYLYKNSEFPILIDVNGNRKPNQLGRDRFVLKFGNSLAPRDNYPSDINAVLLWDDYINKDRWCPQGECYFKTWITKGK